ncbi:DUF4386 domain-containing protein [Streptomyces sp. NPDC058657]|uniref:DUF4386 domain-containing protein n=1 Tax=unclassified Streptomyces TaxID=2593676 RepID=UPI0036566C3D
MTASTAPLPSDTSSARRPPSAPALLSALSFAALTIAYVVLNSATPQPTATGAEVLAYDRQNGIAVRVGAFLLLASAVPLALLTATLPGRLRALGKAASASAVGPVGGVLATAALILSALFTWTGARLPADAEPALARTVADLSFLTGGVAYAVSFGLFVGGLTVAAGLRNGLLPKPLAVVGIAVAAAGLLATLSLLAAPIG